MNTAHQLARVLGAKRSGRQWVCKCPAHEDASPSLIFWQGHSAVRFKCYAGCDPRDILDILRRRGVFGDDPAQAPNPRKSNPRKSPPPTNGDEERARARKLALVERICRESVHIAGTPGQLYLYKRGIDIALVPDCGGLRWHPKCPWGDGATGCIIGRYSDTLTGEPRGIWRRPINGENPRALGPVGGCVVRLWPDDEVTTSLVIGEGVETVLAASLRITRRGTLLQPAWAAELR
jgi:hypothetical protein